MGRFDKQIEAQRQMVQAEVPEPIVAYSVLQPAGTWGSFGLTKLSPALGMFKQHQANKAAGDLSGRHGVKMNSQTWIALTADKVYAFEGKVSGYKTKIVGKLAEFDRRDVSVELKPGRLATKVIFDTADGGHYELEVTTAMGGQDEFLDELAAMSRT